MLLGSNNKTLALGIRVFLKDEFSGPTRNMTDALRGYKKEFLAFQENLRVARNASAVIATTGALLTKGMVSAVNQGADFLYIMKGVQAITSATRSALEASSKLAMRIGRETMFTPEEVASGMRFMAMAGQQLSTINSTIRAATNLAGATMTRLGGKMGAADILTNTLKAFGLADRESSYVADLLTKAATSANVTLNDLGNSIKYVAATSRNLNIPMTETIAGLMALGNAGIFGSMGGTSLENAYRYLANSLSPSATKKAKAAWASLGLTRKDITSTKGDLLPIYEVMAKIQNKLKSIGSIPTQNILKDIFGVRGQKAAATLMRNLSQYEGFVHLLRRSSGTAQEKMSMMMDEVKGDILKLTSALSGLQVSFAKAVGPTFRSFVRGLTTVVTKLSDFLSTPFGSFLAKLAMGITATVTAVAVLRLGIHSLIYSLRMLSATSKGMQASTRFMVNALLGRATFTGTNPVVPPVGLQSSPVRNVAGFPSTWVQRSGYRYQRYNTPTGRAPSWSVKPLMISGMPRLVAATSRSTSILTGLASVGKGILGFFGGPVGLAFTALSFAMPFIIDALSDNTKATEENTQALKKETPSANANLLFEALKGMSVDEMATALINKFDELIRSNQAQAEAFKEAIENSDFLSIASIYAGTNAGQLEPTFQGGLPDE